MRTDIHSHVRSVLADPIGDPIGGIGDPTRGMRIFRI